MAKARLPALSEFADIFMPEFGSYPLYPIHFSGFFYIVTRPSDFQVKIG
jgi:hypothetical protein|tara:strand:- start:1205 stop:1351 length:147 start_codon:yes stop_codon:yes gene_type:complete